MCTSDCGKRNPLRILEFDFDRQPFLSFGHKTEIRRYMFSVIGCGMRDGLSVVDMLVNIRTHDLLTVYTVWYMSLREVMCSDVDQHVIYIYICIYTYRQIQFQYTSALFIILYSKLCTVAYKGSMYIPDMHVPNTWIFKYISNTWILFILSY